MKLWAAATCLLIVNASLAAKRWTVQTEGLVKALAGSANLARDAQECVSGRDVEDNCRDAVDGNLSTSLTTSKDKNYIQLAFNNESVSEPRGQPLHMVMKVKIASGRGKEVGKTNLALFKPTNQCTTKEEHTSDLAVNGIDNLFNDWSETEEIADQWWKVDLEDIYFVFKIIIHTPYMNTEKNLQEFQILTAKTTSHAPSTVNGWSEVFTQQDPVDKDFLTIGVTGPARQVAVITSNRYGLRLKEVKVFGVPNENLLHHESTEISFKKTITDPDTSFLMDGLVNLLDGAQPIVGLEWIWVKLKKEYQLFRINVYNWPIPENLALNKETNVTSTGYLGHNGSVLTNGRINSFEMNKYDYLDRFITDKSSQQWIYVDLQQLSNISMAYIYSARESDYFMEDVHMYCTEYSNGTSYSATDSDYWTRIISSHSTHSSLEYFQQFNSTRCYHLAMLGDHHAGMKLSEIVMLGYRDLFSYCSTSASSLAANSSAAYAVQNSAAYFRSSLGRPQWWKVEMNDTYHIARLQVISNSVPSETRASKVSVLAAADGENSNPSPSSDEWMLIHYSEFLPGYYEIKPERHKSYLVIAKMVAIWCNQSVGFGLQNVHAYGFPVSHHEVKIIMADRPDVPPPSQDAENTGVWQKVSMTTTGEMLTLKDFDDVITAWHIGVVTPVERVHFNFITEIEVFGIETENLVSMGAPEQSSILPTTSNASLAADGIIRSSMNSANYLCTGVESHQWWMTTFEETIELNRVEIYRSYQTSEKFEDLSILVENDRFDVDVGTPSLTNSQWKRVGYVEKDPETENFTAFNAANSLSDRTFTKKMAVYKESAGGFAITEVFCFVFENIAPSGLLSFQSIGNTLNNRNFTDYYTTSAGDGIHELIIWMPTRMLVSTIVLFKKTGTDEISLEITVKYDPKYKGSWDKNLPKIKRLKVENVIPVDMGDPYRSLFHSLGFRSSNQFSLSEIEIYGVYNLATPESYLLGPSAFQSSYSDHPFHNPKTGIATHYAEFKLELKSLMRVTRIGVNFYGYLNQACGKKVRISNNNTAVFTIECNSGRFSTGSGSSGKWIAVDLGRIFAVNKVDFDKDNGNYSDITLLFSTTKNHTAPSLSNSHWTVYQHEDEAVSPVVFRPDHIVSRHLALYSDADASLDSTMIFVHGRKNVAMGKFTSQQSTESSSNGTYLSSMAVDELFDGANQFSSTAYNDQIQWWWVNLEGRHHLSKVVLKAGDDSDAVTNVTLLLGPNKEPPPDPSYNSSWIVASNSLIINATSLTQVAIHSHGYIYQVGILSTQPGKLCLTEVMVFGHPMMKNVHLLSTTKTRDEIDFSAQTTVPPWEYVALLNSEHDDRIDITLEPHKLMRCFTILATGDEEVRIGLVNVLMTGSKIANHAALKASGGLALSHSISSTKTFTPADITDIGSYFSSTQPIEKQWWKVNMGQPCRLTAVRIVLVTSALFQPPQNLHLLSTMEENDLLPSLSSNRWHSLGHYHNHTHLISIDFQHDNKVAVQFALFSETGGLTIRHVAIYGFKHCVVANLYSAVTEGSTDERWQKVSTMRLNSFGVAEETFHAGQFLASHVQLRAADNQSLNLAEFEIYGYEISSNWEVECSPDSTGCQLVKDHSWLLGNLTDVSKGGYFSENQKLHYLIAKFPSEVFIYNVIIYNQHAIKYLKELYLLSGMDHTKVPSLSSLYWSKQFYQKLAQSPHGVNKVFYPELYTRNLAVYSTNYKGLFVEELIIMYKSRDNLAQNKTTDQSSTAAEYTSTLATDGDMNTYTQTLTLLNQWWRLDMINTYMVSTVVVHTAKALPSVHVRENFVQLNRTKAVSSGWINNSPARLAINGNLSDYFESSKEPNQWLQIRFPLLVYVESVKVWNRVGHAMIFSSISILSTTNLNVSAPSPDGKGWTLLKYLSSGTRKQKLEVMFDRVIAVRRFAFHCHEKSGFVVTEVEIYGYRKDGKVAGENVKLSSFSGQSSSSHLKVTKRQAHQWISLDLLEMHQVTRIEFYFVLAGEIAGIHLLASCYESGVDDPSLNSIHWRVLGSYTIASDSEEHNSSYITFKIPELARRIAVYRETAGGLRFKDVKVFGYQDFVPKNYSLLLSDEVDDPPINSCGWQAIPFNSSVYSLYEVFDINPPAPVRHITVISNSNYGVRLFEVQVFGRGAPVTDGRKVRSMKVQKVMMGDDQIHVRQLPARNVKTNMRGLKNVPLTLMRWKN